MSTAPKDAKPDWTQFLAIGAEIERLQAEGRWTIEEYRRLIPAARKAAQDDPDLLEGFVAQRPASRS